MKSGYIVLGTNDFEAAISFYNALFDQSGLHPALTTDRMSYWMGGDLAFAVAKPFDEQPATNGNGTMIGLDVGSVEEVDRLYRKTLELGGSDEGTPQQRGPYYSAYVRDLDRNKLCLYHMPAATEAA